MLNLAGISKLVIFTCTTVSFETTATYTGQNKPEVSPKRSDNCMVDFYEIMVKQRLAVELLRKDVQTFKKKNDEVLQKLADLEKRMNKTEGDQGPTGFSVTLNNSIDFNAETHVPFDNVILNLGGGFKTSNGTFYCPRKGLYHFTLSVTSGTKHVDFFFKKNAVTFGYVFRAFDETWDSTSGAALIYLNMGDRVWIETGKTNVHLFKWSQFIGFRISD